MLLGPQISEQVRDPAVDRAEAVQARMAGPAEGDQRGGPVRGPAVVDDERIGGEADAAEAAVAGEDPVALPREAGAVAAAAVVAGLAPPAAVEGQGSAGAAQRELLMLAVGGHEQSAVFSPAPAGGGERCGPASTLVRHDGRSSPSSVKITFDKRHYHRGFYPLRQASSGPVPGPAGAEKGPQLRPVKSRFRGRFSQVLEVHLEAANASEGL